MLEEETTMATESIDYTKVLEDLELKRTAIETTIAGVRQMLNLGADRTIGAAVQGAGGDRKEQQAGEVLHDSFFGMSAPDAIRKFLNMMKRPQSASDIAKAMHDGGLPTTSDNIGKVIGPTLSRMKANGDLFLHKGKWAPSDWYSVGARERLEAVEKGKSKKNRKAGRPKGSKAKPKAQTKSEASPNPTEKPASSKPTPEQIEQIMKLHASGKKPGEIAKAVSLHHFVVMGVIKSEQAA
jgi:hypothetical protein